jgi:hypothetical protein
MICLEAFFPTKHNKTSPRLIELEDVLITNPKFQAKEKMLSILKTHLFMFFVDNPSSKSAIEASLSNPPSPRTIKNTKQNCSSSTILPSITQTHITNLLEFINLRQITPHTHVHKGRTVLIK